MIIEKYFGIDREAALQMIEATNNMTSEKSGDNGFQNTKVFLFDEYAVLKMQNINVRNVATQDADLKHLERLSETLLELQAKGVNVIPILAFQSDDGNGYIIQKRAKGIELYDRDKLNDKNYVLERVEFFSNVPQEHYDKFFADAMRIIDAGVIVDCVGKDNFFYHKVIGFQFVDLNAHDDYEYGLSNEKPQGSKAAFISCFLPLSHCPFYFISMPKHSEMVSNLLSDMTDEDHSVLQEHNKIIFGKCRTASINNGIADEVVNEWITSHKFILKMQQLDLL